MDIFSNYNIFQQILIVFLSLIVLVGLLSFISKPFVMLYNRFSSKRHKEV